MSPTGRENSEVSDSLGLWRAGVAARLPVLGLAAPARRAWSPGRARWPARRGETARMRRLLALKTTHIRRKMPVPKAIRKDFGISSGFPSRRRSHRCGEGLGRGRGEVADCNAHCQNAPAAHILEDGNRQPGRACPAGREILPATAACGGIGWLAVPWRAAEAPCRQRAQNIAWSSANSLAFKSDTAQCVMPPAVQEMAL